MGEVKKRRSSDFAIPSLPFCIVGFAVPGACSPGEVAVADQDQRPSKG